MSKRTIFILAFAAIGAGCNSHEAANPDDLGAGNASTGGEAASNDQRVASNVSSDCAHASVYFDTDEAHLDDADRTQLRVLASCIDRREADTIYVEGGTDPSGTPEHNLALGEQRAEAVADYLRALGCSAEFRVKSRGEAGAADERVLWPRDRAADVMVTNE